jgi:hypothetical protein
MTWCIRDAQGNHMKTALDLLAAGKPVVKPDMPSFG